METMVNFIIENIDVDDVKNTYRKMAVNRTPLYHQNHTLFNRVDDLIVEFCNDNDIEDDFDVEEIFEKVLDKILA